MVLTQRLKWAAIVSFVVAMAVLLSGGLLASRRMAPYPGRVVDESGRLLFER